MSSLFSVNGKIALVTGGTSGIGYMIAQGLVKHGAKVYVASRKAEACANTAEALSAFGTCIGIPADLSTEQGCVDLVNEIQQREGRLNILVNNAGVTWGAPLEQYPADAWDKIQNLNVKSAFVMTQKSLPMLEAAASAADPARVINITSVAGQMYGSMQAYAYGPSKAALNHLTKILAGELAAKHITVNAIAPGVFPSRMTTFVLKDEKMAEQQRNAVPPGRAGGHGRVGGISVVTSRGLHHR